MRHHSSHGLKGDGSTGITSMIVDTCPDRVSICFSGQLTFLSARAIPFRLRGGCFDVSRKLIGVIALCRGSSGIRLSGFAGTSHYERGSVMDSDFRASRIPVVWDPFRVLIGWPGSGA